MIMVIKFYMIVARIVFAMNNFKHKLQDFFKAFQIKQKAFAKIMSVSEVTVSNWVKGRSTPTKPMRDRIDGVIRQYYRAIQPIYKSFCCNAPVGATFICPDDSGVLEADCHKCWKFGQVYEENK